MTDEDLKGVIFTDIFDKKRGADNPKPIPLVARLVFTFLGLVAVVCILPFMIFMGTIYGIAGVFEALVGVKKYGLGDNMNFNDFKINVEQWASVRGIYEQSTEAHQKAKAFEEVGEYLTASDMDERMDAIGDIAVCIVNAAYFCAPTPVKFNITMVEGFMATVASCIIRGNYQNSINALINVADLHGYVFGECLERAWDEIKDRKGIMSEGKYVKWESMNGEQRKEFNFRDSGNTLIRA